MVLVLPNQGTAYRRFPSGVTFAGVVAALPEGIDAVRLYENYLSTFAINQGR